MSQSIPVTELDEISSTNRNDIFLISKYNAENSYDSSKIIYSNLSSSIYRDIRPYISDTLSNVILTSDYTNPQSNLLNKTYPCATTKMIWDKINNELPNKLDKFTTNPQTVNSQVNINNKIKCNTPDDTDDGRTVVNKDYLTNKSIILIYNYHEGSTHCRVWNDGWCEQSGRTQTTEVNNIQKCTFHIPFRDSNYVVVATPMGTDLRNNVGQGIYYSPKAGYTLNPEYFFYKNDLEKGEYVSWMAHGYVNI